MTVWQIIAPHQDSTKVYMNMETPARMLSGNCYQTGQTDGITYANGLHNVHADSHFMWGSVMYGYLIYDTIFTLVFYNAVGTVAFLLHHCLGLTCCCFGLYFNKMALFGTAIEVFFEGTTPLLHLMGCLKLMGQEGTPSYTAIGATLCTHSGRQDANLPQKSRTCIYLAVYEWCQLSKLLPASTAACHFAQSNQEKLLS